MARFLALVALVLVGCGDAPIPSGSNLEMAQSNQSSAGEEVPDSDASPTAIDELRRVHFDEPTVDVGRPPTEVGELPIFERIYAPPLTSHEFERFVRDIGYGGGGAVVDFDGDGDLDVFLARPTSGQSDLACVYENHSEPGLIAFERRSDWCLAEAFLHGGIAFPVEGAWRLIVYGTDLVALASMSGGQLTLEPVYSGSEECGVNAVLPADLDADADLDLLVACARSANEEEQLGDRPNFALLQAPDGSFSSASVERFPTLGRWDNTLALGAYDVDQNGLMDIAIVNDTFSSPNRRITSTPPGGMLIRCAPQDTCQFSSRSWVQGNERWGSFMGFGVVEVDGAAHLVLSDNGPARLIDVRSNEWIDRAPEVGFAVFPVRPPRYQFSWGVVVEDFDNNGLDDALLTHGMVVSDAPDAVFLEHSDLLLMQRHGGAFVAASELVGIEPSRHELGATQRPYSARGATLVDFDRDGSPEILEMPLEGYPRLYRTAIEDRCTILAQSPYTPTVGYGIGVGESSSTIRHRAVQGQQRLGAAPSVIGPSTGVVEFPSGTIVTYECAESGNVSVREPEWLTLRRDGDTIIVDVDLAYRDPIEDAVFAVRDDEGNVVVHTPEIAEDGAVCPVNADARWVMVQLNGRWVQRWFEVD